MRAPQLSHWVWLINLAALDGRNWLRFALCFANLEREQLRWFTAGVSPALELKDCFRFAEGWCILWKLSACPAPFMDVPFYSNCARFAVILKKKLLKPPFRGDLNKCLLSLEKKKTVNNFVGGAATNWIDSSHCSGTWLDVYRLDNNCYFW